jgi:hypothetical protein
MARGRGEARACLFAGGGMNLPAQDHLARVCFVQDEHGHVKIGWSNNGGANWRR